MSELPFVPYEGDDPYIFVSYAHKNRDKVYPIIKRLHEMGYRLWYDEGIEAGDEWPDVIERHLKRAAVMLLFLTPQAVESRNVRSEINVAWDDNIKTIGVDLVPTELKYGLSLRLTLPQRVMYYNYADEAAFYAKLQKGLPAKTKQIKPTPTTATAISPISSHVQRLSNDIGNIMDNFVMSVMAPTVLKTVQPEPEPTSKQPLPFELIPKPSPETDFEWQIMDGVVYLRKYKGKSKCAVIPSMYRGKQVMKISDKAFSGSDVSSVIIPMGMGQIIRRPFYGCESLSDIVIPKSVTFISDTAFGDENNPSNPNLTFHCSRGSYSEKYAKEHNFKVKYPD